MAIATADNSKNTSPGLGVFTPWRSENGKNQRMAGDMLSAFTQASGVTKKDEKEYDRDYRDQQRNQNKTTINVTNSTPVSVNNTPAPASNTNAVLPKDMQQDIINRGGKINADGTYVHGSSFEASWNKRNSEERVEAKKQADEALYARAGVTNKEDYFKSDYHKTARSSAVARQSNYKADRAAQLARANS